MNEFFRDRRGVARDHATGRVISRARIDAEGWIFRARTLAEGTPNDAAPPLGAPQLDEGLDEGLDDMPTPPPHKAAQLDEAPPVVEDAAQVPQPAPQAPQPAPQAPAVEEAPPPPAPPAPPAVANLDPASADLLASVLGGIIVRVPAAVAGTSVHKLDDDERADLARAIKLVMDRRFPAVVNAADDLVAFTAVVGMIGMRRYALAQLEAEAAAAAGAQSSSADSETPIGGVS